MRVRLVVVYLAPAREKLWDTKEKWQTAGVGGWVGVREAIPY